MLHKLGVSYQVEKLGVSYQVEKLGVSYQVVYPRGELSGGIN